MLSSFFPKVEKIQVGWMVICKDDSVESGGTGEYIGSRKIFLNKEQAEDWKSQISPDREPILVLFDNGLDLYVEDEPC